MKVKAKNFHRKKKVMQSLPDFSDTRIKLQTDIAVAASEGVDKGTSALMSDYIREQEKSVWMYTTYLK